MHHSAEMPDIATIPESIRAKSLLLRRYSDSDGPAIMELVDCNRDRLRRSFPEMATGLTSTAEVDSFLAEKSELWKARKTFCFGIWLQADDTLIGQLQVKNVVWNVPAAELSYFIGAQFLRQGHATEAIAATIDVAFNSLHFQRVFLRIIRTNAESLALADKLGFSREGLHRSEFRCGFGELHDVHVVSCIAQDYFGGNPSALRSAHPLHVDLETALWQQRVGAPSKRR